MLRNVEEKFCLLCEKAVRGRSDKKFCNDYCRAAYNNELKGSANNFVRNVNNALRKNRRILENLLGGNETMKRVSRDKLLQTGFQFKYLTHTFTTPKKNLYYFCYEFGYLPIPKDSFLIVRKR